MSFILQKFESFKDLHPKFKDKFKNTFNMTDITPEQLTALLLFSEADGLVFRLSQKLDELYSRLEKATDEKEKAELEKKLEQVTKKRQWANTNAILFSDAIQAMNMLKQQ